MTNPLATGEMSPKGTTTAVRVARVELDYLDKRILCSAICKCVAMPAMGKDGRSLKQACVSSRLKAADEVLQHKSPYKSEVNYDMTKTPPVPIMSGEIVTRPHGWLPAWIQKYWNDDSEHPPWRPGRGMVRRPDVVIVNDPSKPPTQDNIKQIVEIKFPPDQLSEEQIQDYNAIAGEGSNKLASLAPRDCDCNSSGQEPFKLPAEELGKAATLSALLYMILTHRPPPAGVPAF